MSDKKTPSSRLAKSEKAEFAFRKCDVLSIAKVSIFLTSVTKNFSHER
jgi:hypothetical protein